MQMDVASIHEAERLFVEVILKTTHTICEMNENMGLNFLKYVIIFIQVFTHAEKHL
jgi:hypothetical protein